MQEYILKVTEPLQRGLKPTEEALGSGQFLTACTFLRSTPYGLRPHASITDPFTYGGSVQFPFPQFIYGREVMMMAYSDSLFTVNTDWSQETTALLYDTFDVSDVWHFIDFDQSWFLINDGVVVYKSYKLGMFGGTDSIEQEDDITVNTGCNFKGRLMLGGFDPDNYWSEEWKGIFEELTQDLPFAMDTTLNAGENYVMWSTIGGGDMFSLFDPNYAMQGPLAEVELETRTSLLIDRWRRNELGLRPMPFRGEVKVMKPLGDSVIVYGSDGIVKLTPVSSPTPTFAQEKLADFGVAGRGAVGGDDRQHLFVAEDGQVFTLSDRMQKLGYEDEISTLIDSPMVVSYDPAENEFHICGSDASFSFGTNGLSKSPNAITSLYYISSDRVGVVHTETSTNVEAATDEFDMDASEVKTITGVEVGMRKTVGAIAYVAVDWRMTTSANWTEGTWVPLNDAGYCGIRRTAKSFKVKVKITDYVDARIDYINVKWQASGKRTTRGYYAAEIGTRPNRGALG